MLVESTVHTRVLFGMLSIVQALVCGPSLRPPPGLRPSLLACKGWERRCRWGPWS